jgi:hypothetical protein
MGWNKRQVPLVTTPLVEYNLTYNKAGMGCYINVPELSFTTYPAVASDVRVNIGNEFGRVVENTVGESV